VKTIPAFEKYYCGHQDCKREYSREQIVEREGQKKVVPYYPYTTCTIIPVTVRCPRGHVVGHYDRDGS